jgi:hypothetical protein
VPALLPQPDPLGFLEYSVVYTDRALNHMSQRFQGVMRDISRILKSVYNGRSAVMGLGLHPWLWGMPSRVRYLRELLDALAHTPGVRTSSLDAIWRHCAEGQQAAN